MKKIIKNALPTALIVEVANYNDVQSGYDIAPKPGIMLQVKQMMNDELNVTIELFQLDPTSNEPGSRKRIFNGHIPVNEKNEPDYKFIEKILKHYSLFK